MLIPSANASTRIFIYFFPTRYANANTSAKYKKLSMIRKHVPCVNTAPKHDVSYSSFVACLPSHLGVWKDAPSCVNPLFYPQPTEGNYLSFKQIVRILIFNRLNCLQFKEMVSGTECSEGLQSPIKCSV